jgi:hypothetical protein
MTTTTFAVTSDTTPDATFELRWRTSAGETSVVAAGLSRADALAASNLCISACRAAGLVVSGFARRTVHASPAEILAAVSAS